ncbi:MAG: protein kinase domain-containing protein [Acidobacteriota bacterium]
MSETLAMMPSPPPAGDPLIGRTIAGRFRIISKLGEGGMGAVYKAEQLKVNRLCAIKILSASFAADPDALARFNREAQMSSAFSHPHAVTIYDFGDDQGLHYLAMEFVAGETLSSVLRREGRLPLARTLTIARQACAALDAAHRMQIVHRDLKPDNIMLSRGDDGDWVKILDFGIAKMAGDAPQRGQDLTQAGFVVGTPLYMSPEQLAGERLDQRSDIYSLAIIIYQMLTGQMPFAGDNMQSIMVKRLTEDPLPMWKVNPQVAIPPGVEAALMHALQRHRDQRTPTVLDFINELEAGCVTTQAQPAAGSTSPFLPGTSSFPGEEAYQTTPSAAPLSPTPPPRPVATGGATLPPTVVASPPASVRGQGAAEPAFFPDMASVPGQAPPYPVPQPSPSPPGYPPVQTGFPPMPSVTPAEKPSPGVGMVLALVSLVGLLILGAGSLAAYFFLWPRDNGQQVQDDTPSRKDRSVQDPPQPPSEDPSGGNTTPSNAAKEAFAGGVQALAQKNYATAERYFRTALDASPGFGKAHLNLGIALYHQQKFDDAVDHLAKAARLCDDEACKNFAWNYRGRLHWEQREYTLAEDAFRQAVIHDANDLSSLAFRGFMLRLGGRTTAANELFDQVLARSQDENLRSVVRQCKGAALPPATASDAGIGPGQ